MARLIRLLSEALITVERLALMGLVAAVAVLVLLNVGGRALGVTLAWADELAILAMVLAAFIGAALMLRARIDPAVLILHELLPARAVALLRGAVSVVALGFGLVLLWICARWLDPVGLAASGFDVAAFEMTRFNFVYTEVTPVLGWPFWWFYLILPWFALSISLHAAANLLEDLGLSPPRALGAELRGEGHTP